MKTCINMFRGYSRCLITYGLYSCASEELACPCIPLAILNCHANDKIISGQPLKKTKKKSLIISPFNAMNLFRRILIRKKMTKVTKYEQIGERCYVVCAKNVNVLLI